MLHYISGTTTLNIFLTFRFSILIRLSLAINHSVNNLEFFNLFNRDSPFMNLERQEKCTSLEFLPCFSTKKFRLTEFTNKIN